MVETDLTPEVLELLEKVRVAVVERRLSDAEKHILKAREVIESNKYEKFLRERSCKVSGHSFWDEWFWGKRWHSSSLEGCVRKRRRCVYCAETRDDRYISPVKYSNLF